MCLLQVTPQIVAGGYNTKQEEQQAAAQKIKEECARANVKIERRKIDRSNRMREEIVTWAAFPTYQNRGCVSKNDFSLKIAFHKGIESHDLMAHTKRCMYAIQEAFIPLNENGGV